MSAKVLLARIIYWFAGLKEDPHELFSRIGVEKDDEILEMGCAIGFHTFPLADLAEDGKVYAVDISEEFIDYMERKSKNEGYENIVPLCEDAEEIGLENEDLDKIVCFDTLHELEDPGNGLRDMLDHLRSNGLFLYRDPEISVEKILEYSERDLVYVEEIKRTHVFKKK